MSSTLLLGNVAPILTRKAEDGTTVSTDATDLGTQVTLVQYPAGGSQSEAAELAAQTSNDRTLNRILRVLGTGKVARSYALALCDLDQLWWGVHAGDAPEWVASDDKALADATRTYFAGEGQEPEVRPFADASQVREQAVTAGQVPPIGGGSPELDELVDRMGRDVLEFMGLRFRTHELITNGGRDLVHLASFGTAAQPGAANIMAVTANSTAPAATDTTLTGEIVTAGGGLIAAAATFAHTTGTNTSTLTRTLTANASDSLPVVLAKIGVRNAAATLAIESLLSATATLNAVGDNVTITDTITAG